MPRRASCAATIVPEKPPPMIATGTRSDVIIGPILRPRRPSPYLLDVMIGFGHPATRGIGPPAWNPGGDQGPQAGADQLEADPHCAPAVLRPADPQRARMLEEEAVNDALLGFDLVGRHDPSNPCW